MSELGVKCGMGGALTRRPDETDEQLRARFRARCAGEVVLLPEGEWDAWRAAQRLGGWEAIYEMITEHDRRRAGEVLQAAVSYPSRKT
jgi:hypothetical protein